MNFDACLMSLSSSSDFEARLGLTSASHSAQSVILARAESRLREDGAGAGTDIPKEREIMLFRTLAFMDD